MGYDLRYEAVCKYTEDGINQSKELLSFLKKRQAIEQEYTKALSKLCKGTERQTKRHSKKISVVGAGGVPITEPDPAEKASVERTQLQQAIDDVIDETSSMCNAHEKIALGLAATIIEPLQKHIKDMEQTRKEYLEHGFKITKVLQDQYTALKKAKVEFDDAQKIADDVNEKHTTAQNTPSTKEKDLEKIASKASQANEKAQKLLESYNEAENACKTSQDAYYKQELPALLDKFTKREKEREYAVKSFLTQYTEIESAVLLEKTVYSSSMSQAVAAVDVDEDIQNFVDDHVRDETLGANVSVRSLINPTKSGRLLKLVADEWKVRYCVLLGEEQLLYVFDSEDSVKPRGVIDMKGQAVHAVDDSYFGKTGCFQLVGIDYNSRKEDSKIHYFVCDHEDEKSDWLLKLRFHDTNKQANAGSHDHKVVRSLKIEIMEGRDLSSSDMLRRSMDPYAVICMNQIKMAKTLVKLNSSAPFWGETFYFDDIHPKISNLTLYVVNQSRIRIQKDTEIGKIHFSFDQLPRNKQIEEWFSLIPITAGEGDGTISPKESDLGGIRAKITFMEEKVLPIEDYQPLLELLTEPDMAVVRRIGEVITKEREEVGRRLLKIFSTRPGGCVEFLRVLTYYEVNNTEDPNILFRGNSLATKAVDQYMKMIGSRYLHNTLKNLVQTVYKDSQSCEVDPTRVEKSDEMKKNWKRLNNYVTNFWETIANAADKCPWELKYVFYNLQADVMAKFNNDRVRHIAVAGFIFLRFFCPAILDPSLFGMAAEHPDPNTSRTLTLVAKTLQNLANLVEFGAKEPYMADMNQFITKNLDAMKVCIEKMSAMPKLDLPPSVVLDVELRRELASFYSLTEKLTELHEAYATQPDDILGGFFAKINELSDIYNSRKPGRRTSGDSNPSALQVSTDGIGSSPSHDQLLSPNASKTPAKIPPPRPTTGPVRPPPSVPSTFAPAATGAMAATSAPAPAPAPAPTSQPSTIAPPPLGAPIPPAKPKTSLIDPIAPPEPAPKPRGLIDSVTPPEPAPKPRPSHTRNKSIEKMADLPVPKTGPPPLAAKPTSLIPTDVMKELASRSIPKHDD